uniref:Integrase catalytic domain-containing protein n=1 Tax=Solanum tuberosum TaxID=4113 RepID=M1BRB2_SOLTU
MKDTCSRPSGLLLPFPIPSAIFEDISMDFITGLPPSHGRTVILVIVDRLSKYGHFIALPPKFTSHKIAKVFVQEYIRLHGFPSTIISDRDPIFLSEFWAEINRLQGTQLAKSSAYHPQSDGQTEALNKCLEMYLPCFAVDNPTSWLPLLPWQSFGITPLTNTALS